MENLLLQCQDFNRAQKYINAIKSGEKCMERALGLGNTQVEIEAALEIWRAFRLLNKDDSAGALYKQKCIEFVKQCLNENPQLEQYRCHISEDDSAAQVEMKVHFAIIQNSLHRKSRMEQAVMHGKKCIEIAQVIDDKSSEMNAYLLLAKTYFQLEQCNKANYCCMCSKIQSTVNDRAEELLDLHNASQRYTEAIGYADKIIEVGKDSNDMKWKSIGYLMKGEIYCYCNVSDYDSSLAAFTEALSVFKEINDNEGASTAMFWIERVKGLNCYKKNDKQAAIVHYKQAVEIFNEENKYRLFETLRDLHDLQNSLEQYSEAMEYADKIIQLAKHSNDMKWESIGYLMKGKVYSFMGDCDSILLALTEAQKICKKNNDSEGVKFASFWLESVHVLQCVMKTDIKAAIFHSEKAVEYIKDKSKCNLIDLMDTFRNLIFSCCKSNQYSEALQLAESILQVARDDIQDERWEFNGYLIKGLVHINLGDHTSALSAFDESLRISEKCNASDSDLAEVYLHQSVSYFFFEDFQKAKNCFCSYFAISRPDEISSIEHFIDELLSDQQNMEEISSIEHSMDDFSSIHQAMDELQLTPKCDPHNITVESITEALKPNFPELTEIFTSSTRFRTLHIILAEIARRQPLLQALLSFSVLKLLARFEDFMMNDVFKDLLKPVIMHHITQLTGRGFTDLLDSVISMILQENKQIIFSPQEIGAMSSCIMVHYLDGNFQTCEKALNSSLKIVEKAVSSLAVEKHKITFIEQYVIIYKFLLKVLVKMENEEKALWVAESCRAKELKFRLLHREIEEEDITSTEIQSYVSNRRKCAIIFYIWCFDDLFTYSIQRGDGKDIAVIKMYFKKKCKKHLDSLIKRVLSQISGCAMQELPAVPRAADNEDEDAKHKDYCCHVARAGQPSENECSDYNDTNAKEDSEHKLREELYEILIPPLDTTDLDELVIIPEGLLYLLPFSTLQNRTTKHYLSQDTKLRFSPCMTTLVTHKTVADDYYARSGSLIIGNPSVDGIEGLEPLPGSQREAETIAQIIGGVMPLTGQRATKSAVLERLFEVCIAHFACHIKLNPSAIVLSPEGPLQNDDDSYLLKPEDIMEKGIHARLVVLSGCNSGLGKICAEGVVGIARAFLAAGAASVLVSLWRIDDHSTCEFMTIFYTYFLDWDVRRSASESLHLTINTMRTRYPNEPEKWSGFYLLGDDVTIDRESLSVMQTKRKPPDPRGREPCENEG